MTTTNRTLRVGMTCLLVAASMDISVGWAAEKSATTPIRVYIMAGQSNMEGPGSIDKFPEKDRGLLTPRADVWITWAGKPTGPLKPGYGAFGFGPELGFGNVLGDALDSDAFIIKVAVGGTTQAIDWRPPSAVKRAGGSVGYLYERLIKRVHSLLAHFEEFYPPSKGRGFEVAGLLWLQGESDSCNDQQTADYKANFFDFIKDVRSDLGIPDLPIIIAEINDAPQWEGNGRGEKVRAIQQQATKELAHVSIFETKDLDPGYHYDTPSIVEIGRRFGKAALAIKDVKVPQRMEDIARARKAFLERTYPPPVANPDTRSLTNGLRGYWKFDEGKNKFATDSSPNKYDGELKENPSWTDGIRGTAIRMTGAQKIEVPAFKETLNKAGRIENLSISYWVRTPLGLGMTRIGKGTGHPWKKEGPTWAKEWDISPMANNAGWDMSNCDSSGLSHFTAFIDGLGPQRSVMGMEEFRICSDGYDWHHVVGVYDGTKRSMRVYVDAHLADNVTEGLAGNHILPAKTILTIGGYLDGETNYQVFDEVAIWDRPLTEAEIATLYNKGGGAEIK